MISDDAPTLVRPLQVGMALPLAAPLPWLPAPRRVTLVCRCSICGSGAHGKTACSMRIEDGRGGVS